MIIFSPSLNSQNDVNCTKREAVVFHAIFNILRSQTYCGQSLNLDSFSVSKSFWKVFMYDSCLKFKFISYSELPMGLIRPVFLVLITMYQ